MNNLILCSNNDELAYYTVPVAATDAKIAHRQIKISDKIEQLRVLYESSTRGILSMKTASAETKVYQFDKKEAAATEWTFKELNIQIKSNGVYSVIAEKNSGAQQILEATSKEQKLNFQVSTINEQSLANTRSYSVELPENMGDIEYLAFSTVKQTQLVTLRMQDGSLLVIKLAENGGRAPISLGQKIFNDFLILADLLLHRDEALSSIISVETFDLSLSVSQMHIEEEFGGTGILSMFTKRISSQLSQLMVRGESMVDREKHVSRRLQSFFARLMDFFTHGNKNRAYMDKQAALVRDEFNLNKIIIVVTSVGKVNISSSGTVISRTLFFLRCSGLWHSHSKWRHSVEALLHQLRTLRAFRHRPSASLSHPICCSLHPSPVGNHCVSRSSKAESRAFDSTQDCFDLDLAVRDSHSNVQSLHG